MEFSFIIREIPLNVPKLDRILSSKLVVDVTVSKDTPSNIYFINSVQQHPDTNTTTTLYDQDPSH